MGPGMIQLLTYVMGRAQAHDPCSCFGARRVHTCRTSNCTTATHCSKLQHWSGARASNTCVCVCVFMLLCPQPHAVPTSTNKLQAHRKGLSLSSPPASTLAEPAPHPVNDFGLAASPETLSPCPPTYFCLLSVQSEHMFVESDIDCS